MDLSAYDQLNDPVHKRCREKHIKSLNKWECTQLDVNIDTQSSTEESEEELGIEFDILINPCSICSFNLYIQGDPNDSLKNSIIKLGENGIANCNEWTDTKNADQL